MSKQATWKSKRTPFEVIAALTDFARLSQQASVLLAHAHETPTTLGLRLLTRLLSLCSADQGTFVPPLIAGERRTPARQTTTTKSQNREIHRNT